MFQVCVSLSKREQKNLLRTLRLNKSFFICFMWPRGNHARLFLSGHGNESCNLVGSQCDPDFPISAHGHGKAFVVHREHPQLRCHFKQIIFTQIKPINDLLIVSFLTLESLWLTAENCFRDEFVVVKVSLLNGLTRGLKTES